jgi:hypothetical protein
MFLRLPLLVYALLLLPLSLAIDFLPNPLKLSLSLHTLICRISLVIGCSRGWFNVVANMIIVAFFGVRVLKYLISFLDLDKPLIELPLLVNLSESLPLAFDTCRVRVILKGKTAELILDLINRCFSRNT